MVGVNRVLNTVDHLFNRWLRSGTVVRQWGEFESGAITGFDRPKCGGIGPAISRLPIAALAGDHTIQAVVFVFDDGSVRPQATIEVAQSTVFELINTSL